jgi:dipeptidyl-peptidase-4
MGYNTTPLVYGAPGDPVWMPDGRFWYHVGRANGSEFMIVDPAKGTSPAPAFDHTRLAEALSTAAGAKYTGGALPFRSIDLSDDNTTVSFAVSGKRWQCALDSYRCTPAASLPANSIVSPDKKRAAFIREYNLWVRDIATGAETQLTTDGVKDFGYATDNAGWIHSDRPILLWSPDSRKIATFQQDQRGVGEMYLVSTTVGHPKLEAWKYPLVGDDVVTTIQRVVIEVDAKRVIRLRIDPDQHRSTLCDNVTCAGGEWADVQWSPDASRLAFVSTARDHKQERLREADAATGEVREVMEESVPTQFESGDGKVNWKVLYESNEFPLATGKPEK